MRGWIRAWLAVAACVGPTVAYGDPAGLVVEGASPSGTAARAGLRSGDELSTWSTAESSGALTTPFDLYELQISAGQSGPVTLAGTRDGRRLTVTLEPGDWNLDLRPRLSPAGERGYEDAVAALARGDVDAGESSLRRLAEEERGNGDPSTPAFLHMRRGKALAAARRVADARQAFLDARGAAPSEAHRAVILEVESQALVVIPQEAIPSLREAVDLRRRQGPPSLLLAWDLANLAELVRRSGDLPGAEALGKESLAMAEALSPGSLVAGRSLDALTMAVTYRSPEEAWPYGEQALAIRKRLAPVSAGMVRTLTLLGGLVLHKGDLRGTEEYWSQALALQRQVEKGGPGEAVTLHNSSILAQERGDLERAEAMARQALAISEKTSPGSPEHVNDLTVLCAYAMDRGDWAGAEGLCLRAVATAERTGKDTLEASMALANLGEIAHWLGRPDESDASFARAIALLDRKTPKFLVVAEVEMMWARCRLDSGDLAGASEIATRARLHLERAGNDGLLYGKTLQVLADVALFSGDPTAARDLYTRALRIRERLAPASRFEAETLGGLARVERLLGDSDAALAYGARAVDALDRQRGRLGGTYEARSRFAAVAVATYYDHLDLLLETGQVAKAFHTLERSRARAFLDNLAERDLDLAEVPPEREAERRRLDAAYDRAYAALSDVPAAGGDAARDAAAQAVREIADRREAFAQQVARESPSAASLRYPVPLDLAAARATLDPGTVLLAYAVSAERTVLFVVEPASAPGPGIAAAVIPAGDAPLRRAVQAFRRAIEAGPSGNAAALRTAGEALYALLLQPVETRVAAARRIVLAPDGPLHLLPFSALVRGGHPLVLWKPISIVPSATAVAEIRRREVDRGRTPSATRGRLVAFGDPAYSAGRDLRPLRGTRGEVRTIAALFPNRAEVFVGADATESRAKRIAKDVRYVHFACHGLIDQRFPFDSALALSDGGLAEGDASAGGDNGRLQAWEILERVRVDADLVTLSACESGLGTAVRGEGLLGLTRAFLHAGARTVAASLWAISDRSTVTLMRSFYGHLAAGMPKDEALRRAQAEMVRAGGLHAHPFYWAAFELIGDWR
jgi:CHAT domain-containing protein/Tfp pilus assembly protein PilF